jgi:hypothetical protein
MLDLQPSNTGFDGFDGYDDSPDSVVMTPQQLREFARDAVKEATRESSKVQERTSAAPQAPMTTPAGPFLSGAMLETIMKGMVDIVKASYSSPAPVASTANGSGT